MPNRMHTTSANRLTRALAVVIGLLVAAPLGTGQVQAGKDDKAEATAKKSTAKKSTAKKSTAKKSTAKKSTSKKSSAKKSSKKSSTKGKFKRCFTKKGKKTCRYESIFQGYGIGDSRLRQEPLDRPSGEVWISAPNFNDESVKINIYREDGEFNEEALAQLDMIFRCKRTGEYRAVDPRLYEQLSRIYDHFGQKKIELVSGFRYAERDSSRHFHASAMDIKIDGVSNRKLFEYAESLDIGGMGIGIYPNSGFVHVDIRAPGEKSYRWTDYSGNSAAKSKKGTTRKSSTKKPTS